MRTIVVILLTMAAVATAQERSAGVKMYLNNAKRDYLGYLSLRQNKSGGPTEIYGIVRHLVPGISYMIYLRENGRLTKPACSLTGYVFIPGINEKLSYTNKNITHLGYAVADEKGTVKINISNHYASLAPNDTKNSYLGHAFVLRGNHTFGPSGLLDLSGERDMRVACGVVSEPSTESDPFAELIPSTTRSPPFLTKVKKFSSAILSRIKSYFMKIVKTISLNMSRFFLWGEK